MQSDFVSLSKSFFKNHNFLACQNIENLGHEHCVSLLDVIEHYQHCCANIPLTNFLKLLLNLGEYDTILLCERCGPPQLPRNKFYFPSTPSLLTKHLFSFLTSWNCFLAGLVLLSGSTS